MKTCFFIGHHDAPPEIQDKLDTVVEYLARICDVTDFVVGYHGDFDRMATTAVQKLKERRPEIYAYRLLAYFPGETEVFLPGSFDDFCYPEGMENFLPKYAIKKANQSMLNECDYLVTYVRRSGGNAADILRQARRLEKKGCVRVINLAEEVFDG